MNIDMPLSMYLPREIFSTNHQFDNYHLDDMQCGDLDDGDFQRMGLDDISARVDPFRCLEFELLTNFSTHTSDFHFQRPHGRPISHQQCAEIMFAEMKELSTQFASGSYAPLIGQLIDHFHTGNGPPVLLSFWIVRIAKSFRGMARMIC